MAEEREQRRKIVELLRTRNLGGGQQGVMEWRGSTKPESEIPLSGDHFKQAFGIGGIDEAYSPTKEAASRELLERAIGVLRDYDPHAYIAINAVFDRDVGGYRDLEFFAERAPIVAAEIERGIDRLAALLEGCSLYAEPARPMTEEEEGTLATNNRAVVDTWARRKGEGAKSKEIVAELRGTYGISERRIYQILEQMAPEEKSGRGRPKKFA